tara:strand:- start:575 stop:790 length:216 start_codon:yes stop_codon:yes gene_type:complete
VPTRRNIWLNLIQEFVNFKSLLPPFETVLERKSSRVDGLLKSFSLVRLVEEKIVPILQAPKLMKLVAPAKV